MTTIVYNTKTSAVAFIFAATATQEDFDAAAKAVPDAFVEKIENLSGPELVKIFNAINPGNPPLTKFADKATAVSRVTTALGKAGVPVFAAGAKATKKAKVDAKVEKKAKAKAVTTDRAKATKKAKVDAKVEKKAKAKAVTTDRAEAISKSWKDKKVYAARATRHSVTVNGEGYRSTAQAFQTIGLPIGQHIKFRIALKKAGKLTFEHGNKKFNFTAHKAEA